MRQFFITKSDSYYKMLQFLQNATFIENGDSTQHKCLFNKQALTLTFFRVRFLI